MTIKEIAEKANVSLGTVDRVIHNRGKVSKSTEERILRILKEVDYKPNFYARGLVLNKSYTIGAVLPEFQPGEYWEIPRVGVTRAAQDLKQFGVHVKFFHFDQNESVSFLESARALLDSALDGVILAPVINLQAVRLCLGLRKKQIPFTLIDSKMEGCGSICFIGQDAKQSGRLAAKLLCASIVTREKILIISIKKNENHNKKLQERIEGFKDYLIQEGKLEHLTLEESDIDQRNSHWLDDLERLLYDKKPGGIYVPSSRIHYVAEIVRRRNLKIGLVGNDLIEKNISYVADGTINYVIGQRPEKQGYMALENLYRFLVTRQEVQEDNYLPLDIITKENLKYYKSQI